MQELGTSGTQGKEKEKVKTGPGQGEPASSEGKGPSQGPNQCQQAIGGLVDGLPEEGFTPRLIDMYWTKGAAIVVCLNKETSDWLAKNISTLRAWEGSRLKVVGLDALLYKRVVAWFPGPAEDREWYLQRLCRLNQGLDTDNWRVYKCKEETNGVHLVLSIDSMSISALEKLAWQPFSGMGSATFSLLGVKPGGKK
jgi:hypothetical protein